MSKLIFLMFLFFHAPSIYSEQQIDLYCLYTPAFKSMYEDYFLPSIKDPFRVIARKYPQDCPSGIYGSEGWKTVMSHKLELMIGSHSRALGRSIHFFRYRYHFSQTCFKTGFGSFR